MKSQNVAVIAVSITSATISIVCSSIIIIMLLREKIKKTIQRLHFGMGLMNIIFSLSFCLSSIPAPIGTPGAEFAYGNTSFCSLQGFMSYTGYSCFVLYDAMLSIYFLLFIVHNINSTTMQRKVEPYFHAITLVYSLSSGLFLWATNSFNFSGNICWIAPLPRDCITNSTVECVHGKSSSKYIWYLAFIPFVCSFIIIFFCMSYLIYSVRRQFNRSRRYQFDTPQSLQTTTAVAPELDKETTTQALLYIAGFFITSFFIITYQIIRQEFKKDILWLEFLGMLFLPLQGLFNFLIFLTPRVKSIRRRNQEMSYFRAFLVVVTKGENSRSPNRSVTSRIVEQTFTSTSTSRIPNNWVLSNLQPQSGNESSMNNQDSVQIGVNHCNSSKILIMPNNWVIPNQQPQPDNEISINIQVDAQISELQTNYIDVENCEESKESITTKRFTEVEINFSHNVDPK